MIFCTPISFLSSNVFILKKKKEGVNMISTHYWFINHSLKKGFAEHLSSSVYESLYFAGEGSHFRPQKSPFDVVRVQFCF